MKKRILCLLLALILTIAPGVSALADTDAPSLDTEEEPEETTGEWRWGNGKWHWYVDGKMVFDQWITDGGKVYYVDAAGAMRTGWISIGNGDYRYADKGGAMLSSQWVWYQKHWYYMKDDGLMARNETVTVKGKDYSFKDSGILRTGWISVGNGDYRYTDKDGAMLSSQWVWYQKHWYYIKDDGLMARNECIDVYLVNDSGAWIATWRPAYNCYDNETVYVSRTNIIHQDRYCSGMLHYSTMTLAQALRLGARQCQKCY